MSDNVKQVIVLRTDLNMRKGKMAAQAAHASMAVLLDASETTENGDVIKIRCDDNMMTWLSNSFTKIVLGVASEEELLQCYREARNRGIPCSLITDAGATEFHGVPTNTAIALGPAQSREIDAITGPMGIVKTKLL